MLTVGASYYMTNGAAVPTHGVGEGSPGGGVATWMARDEYSVAGAFAELLWQSLTVQGAAYFSQHDATRDSKQVALLADAGLNDRQLDRFGLDGGGEVVTDVEYDVSTVYFRAGYSVIAGETELLPYAQWDTYINPETIQSKTFGGDNEAGMSDDGRFRKHTLGVVLRPRAYAAIKIDGSQHVQTLNGVTTRYPEVRSSFSVFWEL